MVQMKGDTSFQLGNMEEGDMSKQQHRVPCRWRMMGSLQAPISPILHSKHWPGKLPWKSPLPKLGATGHRVCSRHLFHLYNKPYENRVCACTAYQHTQDAGRHRNALLLMSIRSHWKLSMCLQKKTKSSSAFHSLFPGPPTTVMLWVPTEYANNEIFSWLKVWVASSFKTVPIFSLQILKYQSDFSLGQTKFWRTDKTRLPQKSRINPTSFQIHQGDPSL